MGHEKQEPSVQEELQSIAPRLAQMKDQEPRLTAPDGYFDQLSDELFRRIREDERRSGPQLEQGIFWQRVRNYLFGIRQRPVYAMALAGLALLLVCIAVFSVPGKSDDLAEINLSDEEINDYINYHLDDFDLNLLAEEAAGDPDAQDELILKEDSLDDPLLDQYFDELLDEIDLEELL